MTAMEIQHETTMAIICSNCSSQVRPGINFCLHCGNPVKNLNSVMAGYHPVAGVEQEEAVLEKSDGFGYLTALTFPFRQQNWIENAMVGNAGRVCTLFQSGASFRLADGSCQTNGVCSSRSLAGNKRSEDDSR